MYSVFLVYGAPESVLYFKLQNALYVNADYYKGDLEYKGGELHARPSAKERNSLVCSAGPGILPGNGEEKNPEMG